MAKMSDWERNWRKKEAGLEQRRLELNACTHAETRHTRISTGGMHMTSEGVVENSRQTTICTSCGKEIDDGE